jgi:hypothetical protein
MPYRSDEISYLGAGSFCQLFKFGWGFTCPLVINAPYLVAGGK